MTHVPDPEQLVLCRDRETGLRAIIAIDGTRLGPALDGIRMRAYRSRVSDLLEEARATGATPQLVAEQAALARLQGPAIQTAAA